MPFATALANRWDEAQFPNWDQKFIDRLVTDSPWARTRRITVIHQFPEERFTSFRFTQLGIDLPPVPSIGRPRYPSPGPSSRRDDAGPAVVRLGVDLIVRWASALPVRRALVLQEYGHDGLDNEKAKAKLSEEPRNFVLELAGIPHMIVTPDFEKHLAKTRLFVPGRRSLTPLDVSTVSPGAHVTVQLTFARVGLSADSGAVGFLLESGPLRIDEEFKLRSMIYQGRLEL